MCFIQMLWFLAHFPFPDACIPRERIYAIFCTPLEFTIYTWVTYRMNSLCPKCGTKTKVLIRSETSDAASMLDTEWGAGDCGWQSAIQLIGWQ